MKKNHKKLGGYACCYTYKSSFETQFIHVKYQDDVTAIDLLLANNLERQAVRVANQSYNVFT